VRQEVPQITLVAAAAGFVITELLVNVAECKQTRPRCLLVLVDNRHCLLRNFFVREVKHGTSALLLDLLTLNLCELQMDQILLDFECVEFLEDYAIAEMYGVAHPCQVVNFSNGIV
jgi:hypothetical protein